MDSKSHFKILIIDDDVNLHADFIKILKPKLSSKHKLPLFDIDTAERGEEGLQLVKKALRQGKPYAVAFIDLNMPGWDGLTTTQHIWECDKDIQVVINTAMTNYTWEQINNELKNPENFLIIKKPFDIAEIRQLATSLTTKWLSKQQIKNQIKKLQDQVEEKSVNFENLFSLTKSTLESSTDGILVLDKNKKIVTYNKTFLSLFGLDEKTVENEKDIFKKLSENVIESGPFLKLFHPSDKLADALNIREITLKNERIIEIYSRHHYLGNQLLGNIYIFRDITDHKRLTQKLLHQLTHDNLTGLPNREFLMNQLKNAINNAEDSQQITLFYLGIDNFENISDSLGTHISDYVLKEISKKIEKSAKQCIVAKLENNEFVIAFPSLKDDEEHITSLSNKLLKKISEPIIIEKNYITLTARIGMSAYPTHGHDPGTLLRNAASALHSTMEDKQYTFKVYNNEINKTILKKTLLENHLHQAISNNEFLLYYQPTMQLSTDKIISVSALLRWKHPKLGILYPKDFLSAAEETGLIIPIDTWALRTACQQMKTWEAMGLSEFKMAVNISGQQFRKNNFVKMVERTLSKTQCPANLLEIEIAENIVLESPVKSLEKLTELKNMGVHLVVDNFTMGYVSLNFLKQFPFEKIKIDRKLIQNINKSPQDAVIVEAFIGMIKNIGLEVVAEGVETFGQLSFLREHTSDQVQGYIINKPFTADQFTHFLSDTTRLSFMISH